MSKDEKCTCKACKNTVFHCQTGKFVGFCCRRRSSCLSSLIFKLNENVNERITPSNQKEEVTMKIKGQTPEETVYKHETQAF